MDDITTLADLDAILVALPNALPPHGVHAARKALSRIAQQAHRPAALVAADDLIMRHANLKKAVGTCWHDESSALRALLALSPPPADVLRRVGRGEATMHDALALLDYQDWGEERIRILGCYKRFSRKLLERGILFDELRATRHIVDRHLDSFTHLDFGLQKAGWATMKSRLRRLVSLADTHARTVLKASLLTGTWKDLIQNASDRGAVAKLWGFLAYCWRHALEPEDVNDNVVSEFKLELERRGVAAPFSIARDSVYAWERLAKTTPSWPQIRLQRLYRSHLRQGRPQFEELPPQIQADWALFVEEFGREAPHHQSLSDLIVDDLLDAPFLLSPALKPSSIRNLKSGVIGLYQAAMQLQESPRTLLELVDPKIVATAAKIHFAIQTRVNTESEAVAPKNTGLLNVVSRALSIARRLNAPLTHLEKLEALRDRVDPRLLKIHTDGRRKYRAVEIGGRHKQRIAAFADPVKMHAWMTLPYRLQGRMRQIARAETVPNSREINDAIIAVLYAVTLCNPMRRQNLATLTVRGASPNIWLPPNGKGPGRFHVAADQVKNHTPLYGEFDPFAVEVLSLWIRWFRPAHMKLVRSAPNNPYLFPAHGTGHRAPELLNQRFVERNKAAGFILNLHCQRHLCAKVILDEDPTQIELVRQLLGHHNVKTTERYYAEVNAILVQTKFHELLEARRQFVYGSVPDVLR